MSFNIEAQGLHFSQFNNAPLLLSPANTGLLPDANYRIGALYRNQWGLVPVPFNTFSAFGDMQLFHHYNQGNWLGVGAAFFSDVAGAGDLSLTKIKANIAYHIHLGFYNMLSLGLGIAYGQRSVDFSKLTFDAQWDGFTFNKNLSNQESYTFAKTSYADVAAGINYAFFPNDNVYFRLGIGVLHINQPKESFYDMENRIGMRPVINTNILFQLNASWIAEVTGYYTQQSKAREFVYGAKFSYNVTPREHYPNVLILGVFDRLGDAIIPMAGFEWNTLQFLASWDITTSGLSSAARGIGALEFSVIYKGKYQRHHGRDMSGYNCPRF